MRAANCLRTRFGQAKIPNFAFAYQRGHCADCVLDRRIRIHEMLLVKIDAIDLEPAKTSFARFLYVIGFTVDSEKLLFFRVA